MKSFCIILLSALFACPGFARDHLEEPTRTPPNIILVLIDDLGWGDLSCFGNNAVTTENIDRLADEGLRFEHFYVASPICSPSRVAISTGQYPQRWRIGSFLGSRRQNADRGVDDWLDPSAPSLARQLQAAGYATGHFGKWHMGGQRDVGDAPLISAYGYDESLTNFEGLGPRLLGIGYYHDDRPPRWHALRSDELGPGPVVWQDRSELTATYTRSALAFIRRAEAADKPFFVNVWPDDVHSPFFPPEPRRGDGSKRALYHGVLETMDEQLEELFSYVRGNEKLRGNTLILVCSDNGPEVGAGTAGPLRGSKGMLYEGGVRSPLIVWGPGLLAEGSAGRFDRVSFFASIDLMPSVLAMADMPPPPGTTLDGETMAEVLLGRTQDSRSTPLFFRRPPDRDAYAGIDDLPDLAVRDGRWKLLCEFDGSQAELYDLLEDPGESTDVAPAHPEVSSRLTAAVTAWNASLPEEPAKRDS